MKQIEEVKSEMPNFAALLEGIMALPDLLSRTNSETLNAFQGQLTQQLQQLATVIHDKESQVVRVLSQYLDLATKASDSVSETLVAIQSGLDRLHQPLQSLSQPVTITLSRNNSHG